MPPITRSATARRRATFPFLKLPAEIRNEIYYYSAVTAPIPKPVYGTTTDAIRVYTSTDDAPHAIPLKEARFPALSQTCKQIRGEMVPIYAGENLFSVHDLDEYDTFVERYGDTWPARRLSFIRLYTASPFIMEDGESQGAITIFGLRGITQLYVPRDSHDMKFSGHPDFLTIVASAVKQVFAAEGEQVQAHRGHLLKVLEMVMSIEEGEIDRWPQTLEKMRAIRAAQ